MMLHYEDFLNTLSPDVVTRISTDTRTLQAGDWFVAIRGPHFDGHDYIAQALASGAVGIIAETITDELLQQDKIQCVRVHDSVAALGGMAAAWRERCANTQFVGITGSNGKSTTKEMVASVASANGAVLKTSGNFNNLIGMPLTLFQLSGEERTAVIEMGMSAAGEIAALTKILNPDIGLITNVSAAHLETLQNIENVAAAKGELFATMNAQGTIVVNSEDPLVCAQAEKFDGGKFTYGMRNDCDVQFGRMTAVSLTETELTLYVQGKEYTTHIPVPGVHNVMNALAAAAVGVVLNVAVEDIMQGLSQFSPMQMRMERVQLQNGVQVINDSYNANPVSMQAALRTVGVAKRAGRFVAVLGEMFELGETAAEQHYQLGAEAVRNGVERVYAAGTYASAVAEGAQSAGLAAKSITVDEVSELGGDISQFVQSGDVVLVKGSRGMRMERVVQHLKDCFGVA